MKRQTRVGIIQMTAAGGGLLLAVVFIRSEVLLKILLLASIIFISFLFFPYASFRVTALKMKLFGRAYGWGNRSLNLTGRKLETMAQSLQRLAEAFRISKVTVWPETDRNRLMEELSDSLCRNCPSCEVCWGNRAQESFAAVCELLETACSRGKIDYGELPPQMKENCPYAKRYAETVNEYLNKEFRERQYQRLMEDSRRIVAEQLLETAAAVRNCSRDLFENEETDEVQKQRVFACLYAENVLIREMAFFHRKDSGREVRIIAKSRKGSCITVKTLAKRLEGLLCIPLASAEENRNVVGNEYAEFIFYECPRYHVLTGTARLIREGAGCSGDSFSLMHSGRRNTLMILADGMGSGTEAGRDSGMVVELSEQLMESGFDESSVVKLLNASLVLQSEQVRFTTLDMGILNRYTGNCEFIKAGAATTYIKRKNWVESLASTSSPLGFLDRIDYDRANKKLYHDDYIIMISDGALDCIGIAEREEYMESLIAGITEQSPQEMANAILDGIRNSPGYILKDDITILVTGVFAQAA